ncbi:MAG: hypothetical protein FRX49_08594 [Trebouxia sp. A1-2]|nr:MAG: hypothetical protein FRX49_08594 [Trebouxia sp. A1-2]
MHGVGGQHEGHALGHPIPEHGGWVATNSTVLCANTGGIFQTKVRDEQEMQHVDTDRKDRDVAFLGVEGEKTGVQPYGDGRGGKKGVWQHTEESAKVRCFEELVSMWPQYSRAVAKNCKEWQHHKRNKRKTGKTCKVQHVHVKKTRD